MSDNIKDHTENQALANSASDCLGDVRKQGVHEKGEFNSSTKTAQVNLRYKDQGTLNVNKTQPQRTVEELVQNSPYGCSVENLALKHSRQALARHRRLKTYPGVNNYKDTILGDVNMKDEVKHSGDHKRASTISGPGWRGQYHNIPLFDRLRQSKEKAEIAIKVSILLVKTCIMGMASVRNKPCICFSKFYTT